MRVKTTLFMLLIGGLSSAQMNFEKGYFITNFDERVECLIKNEGWKNSPTIFTYKLNAEENAKTGNIKNVKMFEIYEDEKYIREDVKIDISSESIYSLSNDRNPEFVDKQVFLKELIDGDVDLYEYSDGNMTRFFYDAGDGDIHQLIYKKYENTEKSTISTNDDYKRQLSSVLHCPTISTKEIENVTYKEKYLSALFDKYNHCSNPNYVAKSSNATAKDKLNLYLRPRINFQSLTLSNELDKIEFPKMSATGFGFGLEAEYIFPFNKNKWSVILEPTYQYFKANETQNAKTVSGGKLTTDIDYSSIEIPVGIRHYMYLTDKSKLYINAQYVFEAVMNSSVKFVRNDGSEYKTIEIKSSPNIALGIGYMYNDKFGVEAKIFTNKNLTSDYAYWGSNYKNFSLILSYNLF